MLLVILKGGIDLSVGSIVGLSGVVCGELLGGVTIPGTDTIAYPPVWVVVVLRDRGGHLVGLVNGILVTRFNVAPFIATLGMLYVARGTALLISGRDDLPQPRRRIQSWATPGSRSSATVDPSACRSRSG